MVFVLVSGCLRNPYSQDAVNYGLTTDFTLSVDVRYINFCFYENDYMGQKEVKSGHPTVILKYQPSLTDVLFISFGSMFHCVSEHKYFRLKVNHGSILH